MSNLSTRTAPSSTLVQPAAGSHGPTGGQLAYITPRSDKQQRLVAFFN